MPKSLLRIFRVFSVVFFILIVVITILFADGYYYDLKNKNIIKRGVVNFKGGFKDSEIFLDGQKSDSSMSGELRVEPGPHDIEIKRKGYFPWKKHIVVPEDMVLNFPEVKFLQITDGESLPSFMWVLDTINNNSIASLSDKGVFLVNPDMHFGKYYLFEKPGQTEIYDLPVKFAFKTIIPFEQNRFLGLTVDNKVFLYDMENRDVIFYKELSFLKLSEIDSRFFALDKTGKIRKIIIDDDINVKKFLELDAKITDIQTLSGNEDYIVFLLKTAGANILAATKQDGSILFQETGVGSVYIEKNILYFSKQNTIFTFDLAEKKQLQKYNLPFSIIRLSRVGNTFNFIFLTKEFDLMYCDEDLENCHKIVNLGPKFSFFASSDDRYSFITISTGDQLLLFDFGKDYGLPQLLQNLVSGIF